MAKSFGERLRRLFRKERVVTEQADAPERPETTTEAQAEDVPPNQGPGGSISPGTAIKEFGQDELGRKRFARHLATALSRYEYEDSLVVALYGVWGTGKSSLLNLVELALNELPEEQQPIVVRFNPWNYANQAELVSQFFDVLSVALQRPDLGSKYEKASELLGALSRRAKPFESLPHIGTLLKVATKGAEVVAKGLQGEAEAERDLAHIKSEISSILRKNGKRIVAILDDIDRLSSSEIRQMFQLVKAVGDFSNVIYLLAFDKTVVVPALEEVQKGDGEAYLEKIVNVPIELPVITESQLQKLLIERIDAFAERTEGYNWDGESNRHLVEVFQAFSKLFSTIRQLDRFANLLAFSEGLIAGEVDYADFLGLSALQTTVPNVYTFIRDNPLLFIDTPMSRFLARDDADEVDRKAVDTMLQASQPVRDKVLTLLKELFPKIERICKDSSYSDSSSPEWKKQRRVCASLENFQTYFSLEVPEEAISAARMREVLASLADGTFEAAFQKLIGDGKALAFLEQLKNHTGEAYVLKYVPELVSVLFNAGDVFTDDLRQFPIKMDGPTLILQVVYQTTRRVDSEQQRFECLRLAMLASSKSLYTPLHTISVEDQTHGRYNLGGKENPDSQLVSSGHLDELETLAKSMIEKWAVDGRLATHPKLAYILYRWSNWGGGAEIRDYLLHSLDDAAFISLVHRLAVSESMQHFGAKPKLTEEQIGPLLPLLDARQRLGEISERVETLPESQRQMLAALIADDK